MQLDGMIVGKNGSGEEDVVLRNMAVSRQEEATLSFSVIDGATGKRPGWISRFPYFLPLSPH